jgi:uncharacterized protein (TIGR03083 family)
MIDRSPTPGTSLPGTLLLRTAGACDVGPEHLLEVFGEQRRRFAAVLQGFGPGDWAAPTRCADWSAHDVVRHLCDGNAIGAGAGSDGHHDTVTLTVTQVATAGPPAAQVTDALAGRAPTSAVLGHLPANSRAALSHLADFFNTPVEQRPA